MNRQRTILAVTLSLLLTGVSPVWADVIINILAVNGTDATKDRNISELLP